MTRSTLLKTLAVTGVLALAPAALADGCYVSLTGQYAPSGEISGSGSSYDLDSPYGVTIASGYAWDKGNWGLRAEGEFLWETSQYGTPSVDLRTYGLMANALVDFPLGTDKKLGLYVGGGLGYGNTEAQASSGAGADDNGLLWQFLAGVTYKLDQHWSLAAGYRYLHASSQFGPIDIDVTANIIDIGVRYHF